VCDIPRRLHESEVGRARQKPRHRQTTHAPGAETCAPARGTDRRMTMFADYDDQQTFQPTTIPDLGGPTTRHGTGRHAAGDQYRASACVVAMGCRPRRVLRVPPARRTSHRITVPSAERRSHRRRTGRHGDAMTTCRARSNRLRRGCRRSRHVRRRRTQPGARRATTFHSRTRCPGRRPRRSAAAAEHHHAAAPSTRSVKDDEPVRCPATCGSPPGGHSKTDQQATSDPDLLTRNRRRSVRP